jgi:branched-chain amino acid transport system ATP-binding protein
MLVEEIFRIIREIHQSGTTVLLVEQDANKALSIADYGYVLETGTISLAGDSEQLRRDDTSAGRIWDSRSTPERRVP